MMDEVKEAFGRVSGGMLTGTLARMFAGVAETVTRGEAGEADRLSEGGTMSAVHQGQRGLPQTDIQAAIRVATGQLASITGVLAQTLDSPTAGTSLPAHPPDRSSGGDSDGEDDDDDDDDDDWRVRISKAKEAADRMVESAKVLQDVDVSDSAAWEAMRGYAVKAKEAAEKAARSIANATIQWKLTEELRREALCYRITYPE
ncbi:hypothetical protein ONZ43_g7080 [Nemania bipapillata]|uniref:Uncharacterized protein n=1 Tax=Nemania bipapillata TaxID=110536 RepID=A0ACC2HTW1_9PEZI|nr:hypothetical protein ONZ43_g7080 [Nemania bipapillata]